MTQTAEVIAFNITVMLDLDSPIAATKNTIFWVVTQSTAAEVHRNISVERQWDSAILHGALEPGKSYISPSELM